jgi:tetratricopeptide (TPR) repeat protein
MTQSLLEQGISAALAGRRDEARATLTQVVQSNERNEEAWIWLAGMVNDPQDMRICLENVLELNPNNLKAKQGLAWVEQRYGKRPPAESTAPAAPAPQPPPQSPEAIAALLAPSPQSAQIAEQPVPAAPAGRPGSQSTYRSLHEHPVGSAGNQYTQAPCVYCGAAMLLSQKRCPTCAESQMFRVPAAANAKSKAMTLLAWCWQLPALIGFVTFIFTVFVGFAEGLSRGSPGLLGIVLVIVMVIVFGIVYLLLWSPFLLLARGLHRCRRWAYIIQCVWTAIELAACAIAMLILTRMPGGAAGLLSDPSVRQRSILFSSPAIFWAVQVSTIGWRLFVCVLLWFGSGSVFSRKSRIVPAVKISIESYNNGLAYRERGMWYMAVQEWEGAVLRSPGEPESMHTLGLGYAQIKQFDLARATLDAALQIRPKDAGLLGSRALVDQIEQRGGRW